MASPWYEALFLIGSHLILLVDIGFAIYARLAFVTAIFIATLLASPIYHACQSLDACLFGSSVATWRLIDHTIAVSNIIIPFALVLPTITRTWFHDLETAEDRRHHRDATYWSEVFRVFVLIFVIAIVVVYTLTPGAFGDSFINVVIIVVVCVLVAMLFYIVLIAKGTLLFYTNYDWRYILPGVLLLGGAVVLFALDTSNLYWLVHSGWHILSFSSFPFLIIGTQAYMFKRLIARSCDCGPPKKKEKARS